MPAPPAPNPPPTGAFSGQTGLAIALGANLGDPAATLAAVRPLLEEGLQRWWPGQTSARLRWSPLFSTAAVGGPPGQPDFVNAALLLTPLPSLAAAPAWADPAEAARALLRILQELEASFGRERLVHWGPRTLDLDLLWCGDLHCRTPELELPHPRLLERSFVLAPLAAIDASLIPPGQPAGAGRPVGQLLAQLLAGAAADPPRPLPPSPGWPEGGQRSA
jgi:2-amino-4-hydroxy-6-hydroxymethyldihydropteridine diphosphokinase